MTMKKKRKFLHLQWKTNQLLFVQNFKHLHIHLYLGSAPKAQVTPLTLDALSTSRDAATPRDTASTREMVKHSQTLKDSFINFNGTKIHCLLLKKLGNEVSENIKSKYPNLVERLKEANSLMGGLLENSKLRNVRKPELSESPVVSRTPTPRQTMTSTRIKKTRRVHEPQCNKIA